MQGQDRPHFRNLLGSVQVRYLLVGAWNTLFGFATFTSLWALLEGDLAYGWVLLIAQIIAVVQAHWAQRHLVWRSDGDFWPEIARFSSLYAFTYGANLALLAFCVEALALPVLPSQFVITGLLVVLSFAVNQKWTFRVDETENDC